MHRVLIIDDTQTIRDDFTKILHGDQAPKPSLLGPSEPAKADNPQFEVESVVQGEEGWRKVAAALEEKRPYSVAFVAMRMPPGWDSLQTIQRVWEADGRT